MWANKFRIVKSVDSDGDTVYRVESTRFGLWWVVCNSFTLLHRAERYVEIQLIKSQKPEVVKEYRLGKG